MKNLRKIFCILLSLVLATGLWGCSTESTDVSNEDNGKIVLPEIIFDNWYPIPDVSTDPIVVRADGTCTINGKDWNWVAKSADQDTAVLTVGEGEETFEMTFKRLTTDIPVLAEVSTGWSIKEPKLWSFMGEWFDENGENGFSTSLYAMTEAGCTLTLENDKLTVNVPAGQYAGYKLEITAEQCLVIDPDGTSKIYYPMSV